jgi:hypothetical protein
LIVNTWFCRLSRPGETRQVSWVGMRIMSCFNKLNLYNLLQHRLTEDDSEIGRREKGARLESIKTTDLSVLGVRICNDDTVSDA